MDEERLQRNDQTVSEFVSLNRNGRVSLSIFNLEIFDTTGQARFHVLANIVIFGWNTIDIRASLSAPEKAHLVGLWVKLPTHKT